MANALYERRDQSFTVTVYDTDGTTIVPASTYLNAQYRIKATNTCEALVSKSLGSGITTTTINVNGTSQSVFLVTLEDTDITFNGIAGEYSHSFTVGETPTEVLPSIFDTTIDIVAGCPI